MVVKDNSKSFQLIVVKVQPFARQPSNLKHLAGVRSTMEKSTVLAQ